MIAYPHSLGSITYPPGATFGPRKSTDFELVWIIRGNVEYHRNGIVHHCPAPCMVICVPGATDFFRWDPRRPTRHAYFHFAIPSMPPGLPPVESWPVVRPCGRHDLLTHLFDEVLRLHVPPQRDTATAHPLAAASLISAAQTLLYTFVLGHTPANSPSADALPTPIDRALSHLRITLNANPAAPVSLPDLAHAAAVTPEHLCRLFRKHLSQTPAQAVRLARLEHAASLLTRSNYAVGEIAEMCGFASSFHFSRLFARTYRQSPTQYRANPVQRSISDTKIPNRAI